MKLSKTPDGYVVRVPDDVVVSLGLKDGDSIELRSKPQVVWRRVDDEVRAKALLEMERLSRPLPPGYTFDREEANAR